MVKQEIELVLSLKNIPGIGPIKQSKLRNLNINNGLDLAYHFPRDYEDLRNVKKIIKASDNEAALIYVQITELKPSNKFKKMNSVIKWQVRDNTAEMEVIFFNSAYSLTNYKTNDYCFLFGKVSHEKGRIKMLHPKLFSVEKLGKERILPIYHSTYGITQNDLRKWTRFSIENIDFSKDNLPLETVKRNRLCSLEYAMKNLHFPKDEHKIKEAKYRFIFEEFLYMQLGISIINEIKTKDNIGIAFSKDIDYLKICKGLPFKLTSAQEKVINELFNDMKKEKPMNRLIQGDVGSGKTVVSAFAILKAAENGYQSVLMVPTQLLANQHFNTMNDFLLKNNIRIGNLTSNIKKKERNNLLDKLKTGELDLLIGTQAMLQNDVHFNNLGLVITDEQHRFGVFQRSLLSEKGRSPDKIVMTATPIPRTLAMTLYGDMDTSVIDQLPSHRKEIKTKAYSTKTRKEAYKILHSELKKGRQVFIVSPLIDDSETENPIKSAINLFNELKNYDHELSSYKIGLLHGKLKDDEKNKIMCDFELGEIDVLISTVIIEVGIDIPNASVMLIESAERFGLAQLHQLRGRVGRGKEQSYCLLVANCSNEIAEERINTMVETTDGFIISEKDLKLRGPGDFFGTKQHGLPDLKIADLGKHMKIFEVAKAEAILLLTEDGNLSQEKNSNLKASVRKMFIDSFADTL